jgi:hypothetical protein
VSFNVANTPEQIYWNQKKVREAMAKAGGILPNSISYYQVSLDAAAAAADNIVSQNNCRWLLVHCKTAQNMIDVLAD